MGLRYRFSGPGADIAGAALPTVFCVRKSAAEVDEMNATAVVEVKAEGKPGDNKLTPQIVREPLSKISKKLPLRVLSPEDFAHWQAYGFVVVKQAVSPEKVEALKKLLWEFQEMDPKRPGDVERRPAAQPRDEGAEQQRDGRDL